MQGSRPDTDPILWRSRIADYLTGVRFPATRQQLVDRAVRGNVPRDVLSALLALPRDQYESLADVLADFRPAEHYRTELDQQTPIPKR